MQCSRGVNSTHSLAMRGGNPQRGGVASAVLCLSTPALRRAPGRGILWPHCEPQREWDYT